MGKVENVVSYYVLCNKLKDVIRTGWKDWNVDRERVESVAEHIFGVQSLAIAMWSEYDYDIDIFKVILMLAIHELEEVIIGDLTQFQISRDEKKKLGHKAVSEVLSSLKQGDEIEKLIHEFDERKTKEAHFAYQCDKLECDLQCKLYDEEACVDLSCQDNNPTFKNKDVQRLLAEDRCWSDAWLAFGREKYDYDVNFREISFYVEKNPIGLMKLKKNDGKK